MNICEKICWLIFEFTKSLWKNIYSAWFKERAAIIKKLKLSPIKIKYDTKDEALTVSQSYRICNYSNFIKTIHLNYYL